MIWILLKEAGINLWEALRLCAARVVCATKRKHEWYEYVDVWEDGDYDISIECYYCRRNP